MSIATAGIMALRQLGALNCGIAARNTVSSTAAWLLITHHPSLQALAGTPLPALRCDEPLALSTPRPATRMTTSSPNTRWSPSTT